MEQKRKIIPPVYALLTLGAMTLLHCYWPIKRILTLPYSLVGGLWIALGLTLIGFAMGGFKRAGTPVIPFEPSTALVTTGVYRYTRNPMYLGLTMVLIGSALLFGSVGALLPIPVFVLIVRQRFILGEERFLEEIFGAEYLAYRERVRRWL
jgi:protein-S-isoprenylcysteine O-methyltransferase Ste14